MELINRQPPNDFKKIQLSNIIYKSSKDLKSTTPGSFSSFSNSPVMSLTRYKRGQCSKLQYWVKLELLTGVTYLRIREKI